MAMNNNEEAVGAAKTVDNRFLVYWVGDNDPFCPRSRGLLQKWVFVTIVAMGNLCVTCTSTIYTSTFDQITAEFGVSAVVATLGLSSYLLGLALEPLLLGPLVDFYGRRPVWIISWAIFLAWLIPYAVAKNVETAIITRFFGGFAGSAFLSASSGTASDIFTPNELHPPATIIFVSSSIGPCFGLLLGDFINSHVDWRWTFYFMLIWAGLMMACIITLIPETHHPTILRRKARHLRETTGENRCIPATESSEKSISSEIVSSALCSLRFLTLEPICLMLSFYSAVLIGILYLLVPVYPVIFGNVYGFSLWQVGLANLGLIIGMIVASFTKPLWFRVHAKMLKTNGGTPEPEFQLPSAVIGAVLVPVGLFCFAWTMSTEIHWIVPIIGSGIFGMGTLLVLTGVSGFLVDAYPAYATAVLAAKNFTRCVFGAASPLFGVQMYNKLGYNWASSLLAFLTLAMMPIPWLLFRHGKHLRKRSRYANT